MPDLVNCEDLAEEGAVLERVYELRDLGRMKDLLADPRGTVRAGFAFVKLASGRPAATITVRANPSVVCQRCLQDFALTVHGDSDIEFAPDDEPPAEASEREVFRMDNGLVSLREMAEEELLLALPIAPACDTPLTCGKAPGFATDARMTAGSDDMRRPFSALQNLLKKT